MTVVTRSVSFRTPNCDTVLDKTSQNENGSGPLLDEQRNRYIQCERWTRVREDAAAASTINNIEHTDDKNLVYVVQSSKFP